MPHPMIACNETCLRTPRGRVCVPPRVSILVLSFLLVTIVDITLFCPANESRAEGNKHPRVGLVLSGGGARGIAHIGVLRYLEEQRIPLCCIGGTSMGAIVGALYASGYSPEEMEKLVEKVPWDEAFTDRLPYRDMSFRRKEDHLSHRVDLHVGMKDGKLKASKGLVSGQNLGLLLREFFIHTAGIEDFDKLRVPFRAVAADIETGKAVVLSRGDLVTAVMASMTIPGVFSPVEIDGKMLVDGGIANNLPVDVVRDMGAEVVIVVDIATPLRSRDDLRSMASVTAQVVTILVQRNVLTQLSTLKPGDVLIRPDLGPLGTTDFTRVKDALKAGYAAAVQAADELRGLSIGEEAFRTFMAGQRRGLPEAPRIDYVRIEGGLAALSPEVLRSQVETKEGQPLDLLTLRSDINRLYGFDTFERVDYTLELKGDKKGLLIRPVEKSWGPTYIRFNFSISDNFSGKDSYALGAQITRTAVNSLGAEWRNALQIGATPLILTEFYQPLDFSTCYFVAPRLEYEERIISVHNPEERGMILAEYVAKTLTGGLDMGRRFGNWGELRVGVRRAYGALRVNVGDPAYESGSYNRGGIFSSFLVDTLDDSEIPSSGAALQTTMLHNMPEVGSDFRATGVTVRGDYAVTVDRFTIVPGFGYKGAIDGDVRTSDAYSIGGFLNLSGYLPDELSGKQVGYGRIIVMRNMGSVGLGDYRSLLYLGCSAETGGAWPEDRPVTWGTLTYGGSLFLAAKTFLGPAYLYYGFSEGHRQTIGLFVGQRY